MNECNIIATIIGALIGSVSSIAGAYFVAIRMYKKQLIMTYAREFTHVLNKTLNELCESKTKAAGILKDHYKSHITAKEKFRPILQIYRQKAVQEFDDLWDDYQYNGSEDTDSSKQIFHYYITPDNTSDIQSRESAKTKILQLIDFAHTLTIK